MEKHYSIPIHFSNNARIFHAFIFKKEFVNVSEKFSLLSGENVILRTALIVNFLINWAWNTSTSQALTDIIFSKFKLSLFFFRAVILFYFIENVKVLLILLFTLINFQFLVQILSTFGHSVYSFWHKVLIWRFRVRILL